MNSYILSFLENGILLNKLFIVGRKIFLFPPKAEQVLKRCEVNILRKLLVNLAGFSRFVDGTLFLENPLQNLNGVNGTC